MCVCVCAFSFQSAVCDNLGMLLNQVWVCSPVHTKANLVTPGCVKRSTAFAAGNKQIEQAAHARKVQTPPHRWLSGKGF